MYIPGEKGKELKNNKTKPKPSTQLYTLDNNTRTRVLMLATHRNTKRKRNGDRGSTKGYRESEVCGKQTGAPAAKAPGLTTGLPAGG